jgi:hypothetical protein
MHRNDVTQFLPLLAPLHGALEDSRSIAGSAVSFRSRASSARSSSPRTRRSRLTELPNVPS